MAYIGPDEARSSADAFRSDDDVGGHLPLPAGAQHTLDQIADALGVAKALLQHPGEDAAGAEGARLAEASELLQAFIRIQAPDVRQRCIAFVQQAAASTRPV